MHPIDSKADMSMDVCVNECMYQYLRCVILLTQ